MGSGPSTHGRIFGQVIAELARLGAEEKDPFDPPLPDMCSTCAFRPGTMPNMDAGTLSDALDMLTVHRGDGDFMCHHGMRNDEPTKLCAGFLAARRASIDVVLAALGLSAQLLAGMDDANDPVKARFEEWRGRIDPEKTMDAYQMARAWAKTPPNFN